MLSDQHLLIDMGNGAVYVQRPEPDTASGTPLFANEIVIWKLHSDLLALRAKLKALAEEWRERASAISPEYAGLASGLTEAADDLSTAINPAATP
jgi:hypothetical protein